MSLDSYIQEVTEQWESETEKLKKFPLWESTNDNQAAIIPYFATDTSPKGAVIICAGGAYMWKEPLEAFPHAVWLNSIGLHAFVLDYRVKPPYKQPDSALQDLQRAIRTLRYMADEWMIKKDKIAVLGFSAGGHLAAMSSTHFDSGNPQSDDLVERESCKPDAQILCYPHITYTPYIKDDPDFMVKFFGEGYTEDDVNNANAHYNVQSETPPVFIWGMQGDWQFKQNQWKYYTDALDEKEISYSYHIFPNGSHNEGRECTSPIWKQWTMLCEFWLNDLGF